MIQLTTRLPFTLIMLLVLIAAGIYGRSHVGLLDDSVHRSAGYSMRLMFEGEVHRNHSDRPSELVFHPSPGGRPHVVGGLGALDCISTGHRVQPNLYLAKDVPQVLQITHEKPCNVVLAICSRSLNFALVSHLAQACATDIALAHQERLHFCRLTGFGPGWMKIAHSGSESGRSPTRFVEGGTPSHSIPGEFPAILQFQR